MCGIAGTINFDDLKISKRMVDLFSYRGPDDYGEYTDSQEKVGLAMRRLSIIDLSKGKQPIPNEDKTIWVVCNGEIYNSPDLRQQLLAKGHSFTSNNSDVETLVHLYEEDGVDLLERLNGMFAFVIYDKRKKIIFGARDRIGIKPLYYSCKDGKFAFSSELKSLLLLPWVSKTIDFNSLYHYMGLQFIPGPDSIFCDIKKLASGSYFIYDLSAKNLNVQTYWDLNVTKPLTHKSVSEWKDLIQAQLKESINQWTLSDVPIACSLSGGLDSSALVGFLSKSGINRIRTYTLGYEAADEQDYSELALARMIAKRFDTDHHEIILTPEKILNELERMVWHLDEPYAGGLPSWYIYEFIGQDVKVALTGTGGDELFSNYGKYNIYERAKAYRLWKVFRDMMRFNSIRTFRDFLKYPHGHFYHSYFSDAAKDAIIFSGGQQFKNRTEQYLERLWNNSGSRDPRDAVAYVDFHAQLPEEFLLVTDRFSMAHSVEARTPFLDHKLVELVFQMPSDLRTGRPIHKGFMKSLLKGIVPDELLTAPKKGFVLPLTKWTRTKLRPLIEELLSETFLKKQGLFSSNTIKHIIRPHLEGRSDYTQQVWTLFMFQMWYKKYVL